MESQFFYSYLYSELYHRGLNSDVLSESIYRILIQQLNYDDTINSIGEILQANKAMNTDSLHLAQMLVYYYNNQSLLTVPTQPSDYVTSYGEVPADETAYRSVVGYGIGDSLATPFDPYGYANSIQENGNYRRHSGSIIPLKESSLDDVNIESLQCIDISVNAVTYDPSSSQISSSYTSSSLSHNTSQQDLQDSVVGDMSINIANESEDFSCFDTNLSFSTSHLKSLLSEQLISMPSNLQMITFSPEVLELSLLLSDNDVVIAADILLYNAKIIASTKPCLHARSGGKCYRRDCMFDHEFSEVACKFWFSSQDGCILKDCPFLHGLNIPSTQHKNIVDLSDQKIVENRSTASEFEWKEELFPALPSNASKKPTSSLSDGFAAMSPSNETSSSKQRNKKKVKTIDPSLIFNFSSPKSSSSIPQSNSAISSSKPVASKKSDSIINPIVIVPATMKAGLSQRAHDHEMSSRKVTPNAWIDSGTIPPSTLIYY